MGGIRRAFPPVDRAAFKGSDGSFIAVAHLNEIRMNLITKGVDELGRRQPNTAAQWFALQVRARREKAVADHLSGKDYELYLPLYRSRRRWSDRLKEVEAPLFPGYLFCRFNVHERLPILRTPWVIQVVGYNHSPVPVEESEIAAVRTLVDSGLPSQPWPFLQIGDMVRIESGPLCGLEGILINAKGNHRIVVSVTLLQRSVAVEIDSALVKSLCTGRANRCEQLRVQLCCNQPAV
jgi:transcription antitermination factor NusG